MPRASRLFREAKTDAQLLELARAGDAEAFDAIVDRYRPLLLRYCARLTRPERVDDAVQQTFLNAWLAFERGVAVRELRPWLFSVARNAAIDQLRLHRPDQVELSADLAGGADPAAVTAARGEIDEVLRAVADLPERQRTALLATSVHGRPTEQVADELGMSGGALRQLVHRARTSVRSAVASFIPGPVASWLAQTGGDEGTRRLAVLLTGAGQSATATALAATATVASVGAIGAGGIESLRAPERDASPAASSAGPRSASEGGAAPNASVPRAALTGDAVVTLASSVVATPEAARAVRDEGTGSEGGAERDEGADDPPSEPSQTRAASGVATERRTERDRRGRDRRGREPRSGGGAPDDVATPDARSVSHRPNAFAASRRPGGGEGDGGAWCDPPIPRVDPAPSAKPAKPAEPQPAPTPAADASPSAPATEPASAGTPVRQSGEPGGEGTAGSESSMSSS